MSEIKVGQFYVYRDEDGNAVAIAVMSEGSNGGRMGVDCARMPVPYGKTTREGINNRAEFMAAAMNSFGEHQAALAAKDAEIARLREALKPFAALAGDYDGIPPSKYFGDIDFQMSYPGTTKVSMDLNVLRSARAALSEQTP